MTDALNALAGHPRRLAASRWPGELEGLDSCGLHSWWVDAAGAADLSAGLGIPVERGRIYAGQTGATKWPSGVTGANTLRKRIGQHHIRGRVRSSTFRLTLASALLEALTLKRLGVRQLEPASEAALSDWIRHLELAVHPFPDPDPLVDLERRVLRQLDPPLNLDGMPTTQLRRRLSEMRRTLSVP